MTVELPEDSPVRFLPWIVTFGPLTDDEEWEQVVCGPFERAHALALAESVVLDDELLAVVEPLLPHVSVDEIRAELAAARLAAEGDEDYVEGDDVDLDAAHHYHTEPSATPTPDEVRAGRARVLGRL